MFFASFDHPGCTGQKFLPKNYIEACWKHVWTLLGTFLGILKNWMFSSFLKFFPIWTFQGALGSFFWENYLKTSSKLVWTLLRTFWTLLRNQIFFVFFSNFYKIRSPGCTGQENFGKNYLKQVWTLLERFFGILELWNLFDFCGFFFSLLCALGTAFSVEKLNQNILKQCFWEHFRTILKVSKFFLFLKFFPSLDPPRCTGDFFSKQNYLKTGSEHVWTILGTVLDTLEILNFSIFPNLFLTRPSRVHCAKHLPKKLPRSMLKTCLIAFGNVFSGILNKWKFFQFFEIFPSFDAPGCTGQEKIEKITSSKFGHFLKRFSGFWNFEIFDLCGFFLSLQGSLGTAFSVEKINQNILRQCFWESFRTFLKISKFFFFLKFFPSLDPPGCTGDFFSKKNYLKTGSENVWTILGTALDTLEILKFSIFSNLSLTRPSRVH